MAQYDPGGRKSNKISFILLTITFPFIYIMRQSYIDLIIIQGLLGTFSAFIYITDASLVQKWAQSKERASYVGLYQTGFFVGASFGEFLVLDTFRISLITPFIVIFSLLVAVSILNLIFVRDPLITEVKTVGKISRDIVYVCLMIYINGKVIVSSMNEILLTLAAPNLSPIIPDGIWNKV